jgi:hypothetical protein
MSNIETFQERAASWVKSCFGDEVADSLLERNFRFLEEALELVQAGGFSKYQALALVDYVFNRPIGEPTQEIGGAMITLAALSRIHETSMWVCGEEDLANATIKSDKIRVKWGTKPRNIRGVESI